MRLVMFQLYVEKGIRVGALKFGPLKGFYSEIGKINLEVVNS